MKSFGQIGVRFLVYSLWMKREIVINTYACLTYVYVREQEIVYTFFLSVNINYQMSSVHIVKEYYLLNKFDLSL